MGFSDNLTDPDAQVQQAPEAQSATSGMPAPQNRDTGKGAIRSFFEQAIPGVGPILQSAEQRGAVLPDVRPFERGAADMVTLGNADQVSGLTAGVVAEMQGKDFSEAYGKEVDDYNAQLAYDRIHHGTQNLLGSVAGGVGFGTGAVGALGAAGVRLTNWVSRAFAASALGGAEAGAYAFNSGADAEEIQRQATIGAIGGAVFSTTADLTMGFVRRLLGTNTTGLEKRLGKEMYDALADANVAAGGASRNDPSGVLAKVRENPALILDVYPELQPKMKMMIDAPGNAEAKEAFYHALRVRNHATKDFPEVVEEVLNRPRTRSPGEQAAMLKKRKAEIRPQYDAIFETAQQNGVTYRQSELMKLVTDAIRQTEGADSKEGRAAIKYINQQLRAAGKPVRNAQTGKRVDTKLQMRDVSNLSFNMSAANAKAYKNADPATRKAITRFAEAGRRALVSSMSDNVDYMALRASSKSAQAQNSAYNAGYKLFKNADATSGDVKIAIQNIARPDGEYDKFLRQADSHAELANFIDGARAKIYKDLASRTTIKSKLNYLQGNQVNMQKLAAVVGEQNMQRLVDSAMLHSLHDATDTAVASARKAVKGEPEGKASAIRQAGTDAIIAFRTGTFSGTPMAAGIRAGSNLLGVGGLSGPKQAAQSQMISKVLGADAQNVPEIMKYLQDVQRGATAPTNAPGAVAGGLAGAISADPQVSGTQAANPGNFSQRLNLPPQ